MVDVLDLVCLERGANRSREAVVLREEASEAVWNYVTNRWVSVPGQERWKLKSPVYKWLFLRGEEFGWYPYQNEPWHWEFNPPGFREIFWADFPGGAPERGIIMDEP